MIRQAIENEILVLIKEMDQKIDCLEKIIAKQQSVITKSDKKDNDWNKNVKQLSQMQYEISEELDNSMKNLKNIILKSEKVLNEAKGNETEG